LLVGRITSAAHGHTLDRAVGLGWVGHRAGVSEDWVALGRWQVEIAGERVGARPSMAPLYDPDGTRTRA